MPTQQTKRSKRLVLAPALMLVALVPGVTYSGRLWQAAHCTVCEVTARAQTFYQTIRFVYCVQYQSEHPRAPK